MKRTFLAIAVALTAANPSAFAVTATGGNVTNDVDGARVHIFTNSATASNFVVSVGGNVEVLVVAGGGAGGYFAGGGGAGGLIYSNAFAVTPSVYPVTVGAGGAGKSGVGANGSNSVFGPLTAAGGGGGGARDTAGNAGSSGGSGGGGAPADAAPQGIGGSASPAGQGNAGGNGGGFGWGGGGGGGAGSPGSNATYEAGRKNYDNGGNGGDGLSIAISGSSVYYAGGGGGTYSGGNGTVGSGGLGGGGAGSRTGVGMNGTANTGGGGGGGQYQYIGGNGGSGIVIVRYPMGIDNAGGATNVASTSAWLNGALQAEMPNAAVFVCWGLSDGGTDASAWANTNIWAAPQSAGSFTVQATGLSPNSSYAYRFGVSNESGWTWAPASSVFITGDVWIDKLSDASEIGPTPGTFTVHRASTATNAALTVNLTIGGTAGNGTDYAPLSASATIPEGSDTVAITVTPGFDHFLEGTETVQVTVAPGPYVVGAPASASLDIADLGVVTRTWGGGGANAFASNPTNWVEGEAPIAGDAVLLNATTNKAMTWNLNIPIQAWTQVGYMGTVTVATVCPGQGAFTTLTILGDCTISNGVWTQTANPLYTNYEVSRFRATIGGNLIVGTNGEINVRGKGYQGGTYGPGGDGNGGACHGGRGWPGSIGPQCYGSVVSPTNLGSGGRESSGGGAIIVAVGGSIQNDGLICADGAGWEAAVGYWGSGSGGSIWLTAGALIGGTGGVIRANGGTCPSGRASGGGRIALVVTNAGADFSGFAGTVSAYNGWTGGGGSAGTIYREKPGDVPGKGELIVNNYGGTRGYGVLNTDLSGTEAVTYEFSRITLTNGAILNIGSNDTVIATNTVLVGAGLPNNGIYISGGAFLAPPVFAYSNFFICVSGAGATFSPGTSFTIPTNAEFRVDQPLTMSGDVIIEPGGKLTHTANPAGSAEAYKVNLSVNGSLIVQPGGSIDVSERGFPSNYGPGTHLANSCGGSYGGLGVGGLSCYGSIVAPTNLGSGGRGWGGAAGGAIQLAVSGVVSNGGRICANTTEQTYRTGSGGSISITAGSLTGDGPIQANSAIAMSGDSPGGGGRIALAVTNAGADFSGYPTNKISAYGGRYASGSGCGGAGTVYLRTAGQGLYEGTLIVNNDNLNGLATEISSSVTDRAVANVLIQRKGYLLLAANQSLAVSGIWSNGASCTGLTDSAVIFTGGAGSTSTFFGATTFKGLVCTNGGKTLLFTAGSTNSVAAQGRLTLKGATGAKLLLRSTATDTAWKFNVDPLAEQSVWDVDVKDSDAGGGAEVTAVNSVNDGGNSNWRFITIGAGETNEWTGASNTVWSVRENWSLDRSPVDDDYIRIPGSRPRYPVLDAPRTVNGIEIQSGGSLALNGYNLLVKANATVAGALTASGTETITFQGDANFTGGAVTPAFSTVVLAGSGAQSVNLGGLMFYKVRADNSAADVSFTGGFAATELRCEAPSGTRSLRFAPGETVTLRDLMLRGASPAATNILLRSTSPGVKWKLAVSGYRSVRGVDVQDSDASVGLPIPALYTADSDRNVNWTFGVAPAMWTPTSGNSFHTAANWTPAAVPGAATRVLVESGAAMTMTGVVTVLDFTVGGGAGAVSVTVNGLLTVVEDLIVLSNGTVAVNQPCVVSNDLYVLANGTLTHSANTDAEVNKMTLTVLGNVVVDVNGTITATGKGYSGGKGPGSGTGAGYGGRGSDGYSGGIPSGKCYGSIVAPTNLGSSGAGG